MYIIAGNTVYGRNTRSRVKGGASLSRRIALRTFERKGNIEVNGK